MKRYISILAIFSFVHIGFSQIPNGSWRDHFSYLRAKTLAITPEKVFCGQIKGGMLSYNKEDGEVERHSKITGLSDINITSLAYSDTENVLIIGYNSGNIDILNSSGLVNIPDIKRKSFTESKIINKIKTYSSYAYLACDFGIVVVDLKKHEVKDSYFFGPGGTAIKVNDLAIEGDYLYAATELGLYKVHLDSPNLLDHSFWELQTILPESNAEYKIVESFNSQVFAVYHSATTDEDELLYSDNNDNWITFNYTYDTIINSIDVANNKLCVSGNTGSVIFNNSLIAETTLSVKEPKRILIDEDGTIYSAGNSEGFVKHSGGESNRIKTDSPLLNPEGQVAVKDNHVWVTSGGPNNPWGGGGGYNFSDEHWVSMVSGWGAGMYDVGNFYKIAFDPNDVNHIFASAYRYGLWEIDDHQVVNEYRRSNTPLFESTVEENVDIRIMGLDFDRNGNLWTIFDVTNHPVYVLRNNDEWENLSLNTSFFKQTTNYKDLLVSEYNQVWILTKTYGIIVLEEQSDGTIREKSFVLKNQDDEIISQAYCLTEDKNGYIWVGTNKGPVFYPPMGDVFERGEIQGNSVKIPRNDGTGLADYLLDYETINDIAVDGANRKWIATENSGAFLVSSDGLSTLHQFTFDNSPLISNNIISIGVNEETGEVFFSTNQGLVSFMGTATEGNEDFKDVYVYPNPVRPGYDGDITITGIISDANVKITDISGNLVYETTSLGGQAIWDGKNFDGHRVNTGVYLVFMTNEDGSKTHITKLLFIK